MSDLKATIAPKPVDLKTSIVIPKIVLWIISLTASIYSYYAFKSTHLYSYYSLHRFDNTLVTTLSLSLLYTSLFSLSIYTPSRHLLDPALPAPDTYLASFSTYLEIIGMVVVMKSHELDDDVASVVFYGLLALFMICFLKAVASERGSVFWVEGCY